MLLGAVGAGLWGWMEGLIVSYGYLGAFIISLVGNLTILFPVPYALAIYVFGSALNPILLGGVSGLGAALGEFSAYLAGWGGRRLIEERYGRRLECARILLERYGMLAIFIFSLSPLPTDLIMVPMGMVRYSLRRAFAAIFLGKWLLCTSVAYAGSFSFFLLRDLIGAGGVLVSVISLGALAAVIAALIKIDWSRFVEKLPHEHESEPSKLE